MVTMKHVIYEPHTVYPICALVVICISWYKVCMVCDCLSQQLFAIPLAWLRSVFCEHNLIVLLHVLVPPD